MNKKPPIFQRGLSVQLGGEIDVLAEVPGTLSSISKEDQLARPKGNKIRLTIELDLNPAALNAAKESLVAKVEEMFPALISLSAVVSEVLIEPEPEPKE